MRLTVEEYLYLRKRRPEMCPDPLVSGASSAVAEPPVQHEPMAEKARETRHAGRFHVRVTSFRRRLLDPDNLCAKYFVDCIRYAGFIPNDRAQDITLEVGQIKVAKKEDEFTEIAITPL